MLDIFVSVFFKIINGIQKTLLFLFLLKLSKSKTIQSGFFFFQKNPEIKSQ
jgi:hypothetical protein